MLKISWLKTCPLILDLLACSVDFRVCFYVNAMLCWLRRLSNELWNQAFDVSRLVLFSSVSLLCEALCVSVWTWRILGFLKLLEEHPWYLMKTIIDCRFLWHHEHISNINSCSPWARVFLSVGVTFSSVFYNFLYWFWIISYYTLIVSHGYYPWGYHDFFLRF